MPAEADRSRPPVRVEAGKGGPSQEFTPPGQARKGAIDWVPGYQADGKPGAARAAWMASSKELEPEAPPIPLLDLEAYQLIESVKLVNTPAGGQRLLLNGKELPYHIADDYTPTLEVDPAGGVGRLVIEVLLTPEVKDIEYIDAAQENP